MAITNTRITSTGTTTVFTASGQQAITVLYLTNTSGSTITLDVYAVKNGSTPTTSNCIYYQLQLTANDTYVVSTEKLILDSGDYMVVQASAANSITVTVSSVAV